MRPTPAHSITVPIHDRGIATCDCGAWQRSWSSPYGRTRAIGDAAQHISDNGTSVRLHVAER